MTKNCFKVSVLFSIATLFNACEKNAIEPTNPTNGKTTAVFKEGLTYGTMTDREGNTYRTITIGTQTWMAENLRTTRYNDGSAIPNVKSQNEWASLITGAYCNNNNSTRIDTIATYGRLYNWYAVNTGKLAPTGWHVPTEGDWKLLARNWGDEVTAGGKLKEAGTAHWESPNSMATNQSGFTALPGAYRVDGFERFGRVGFWWSAWEVNSSLAWNRAMLSGDVFLRAGAAPKNCGYSVRCLKN